MTQSKFYQAQKAAREKYLEIMRDVNRDVSQLYIDAANEVAEKLKTLTLTGKGDSLTAASLRSLESTLRKTGGRIAGEVEKIIVNSIDDSLSQTNKPHTEFINDAIIMADIQKISIDIIEKMYSQLNTTLIELTYSRIWQDGYTFSQKIWGFPGETGGQQYLPGLAQYWETAVKNLITFGLTQNRDILQVAKDLSYYAVHGKKGLMQRYGQIIRGTKQFSKRFPKRIDWRAMRLARSELYISLQDAAKIQGKMNPAAKWYRWNLTTGAVHECVCPDLAADSPYLEGEVPDYPHPNCLCYITHVIIGRDEFVNDLIDWDKGIGVPYLDDWYQKYYLGNL